MANVTVLVPFGRGGRQDWLQEAVASIPTGVPYLILENDGELADALNHGLNQATTEYVIRLDADDLLDAPSVWKLIEAAWDVDVCYGSMTLVSEEPGDNGKLRVVGGHESGEFCPHRLETGNYIPGAGVVIRRESAVRAGGYRHMSALEDWDLWLRLARAGGRFKWRPDATYYYRQVGGSRNKLTDAEFADLHAPIVGAEKPLEATFYAQETTATTYWRCLLPARWLPAQVVPHRPTIVQTGEDKFEFRPHRGAAIWQFPGREYERHTMAAMQEYGIRVLVETDDNYLVRPPYGRTWITGMPSGDPSNAPSSVELHRRIVKWCDGVIVTSEHLGRQYRKATDAPVYVCPNQIDPADWKHEDTPLPDWYDPEKTYVAFAGSPSHYTDVKLAGRALEWASHQPGVEVLVIGFRPSGYRFRYRHIPWTSDISAYRALQRVIDIGLAAVVENPWSVCKSDVKSLEYLMVGACPVLSEAVPYVKWRDGEGCRKARDAADFKRVVRELVANPDQRRDLAAEGREYVMRERLIHQNAWRWQEAIDGTTEAVAA